MVKEEKFTLSQWRRRKLNKSQGVAFCDTLNFGGTYKVRILSEKMCADVFNLIFQSRERRSKTFQNNLNMNIT